MKYALDKFFEGLDCGFMVRRFHTEVLGLRGSELIVFALLYSFSQANLGKGIFSGSCSYIAEATGLSLSTVRRALTELARKKLIVQGSHFYGFGKRTVAWRANIDLCEQMKRSYMIQVNESITANKAPREKGDTDEDDDDEFYFIRDTKAYIEKLGKKRSYEM